MSEVLWGRQVWVEIGVEGQASTRYQGLRVVFDVQMTRMQGANQAKVVIFNLPEQALSDLQSENAVLALFAGYSQPRRIFIGNPLRRNGVDFGRKGADTVTTIKAKGAANKYRASRVSLTYATSVRLSRIASDVAEQLGLDTGIFQVPTEADFEYPDGITIEGSTSQVLDRIATSIRADWFVQDDALFMLPYNEPIPGETIIFSGLAGNMVGSPTRKDNGDVEVTGLMLPDMRPGRLFQVRTSTELVSRSTVFVAREVKFKGDTHGNPFYVTVLGRER